MNISLFSLQNLYLLKSFFEHEPGLLHKIKKNISVRYTSIQKPVMVANIYRNILLSVEIFQHYPQFKWPE